MKVFQSPVWDVSPIRIAFQRLFGWEPMETTIKYKYKYKDSNLIRTSAIRIVLNKITDDVYLYTSRQFILIDTIDNIFLRVREDLRSGILAGYHSDLILNNIDELKFGKIYPITPPKGEPKQLKQAIVDVKNDEELISYILTTCKEKNIPVTYHSEDVTRIIHASINVNHRI